MLTVIYDWSTPNNIPCKQICLALYIIFRAVKDSFCTLTVPISIFCSWGENYFQLPLCWMYPQIHLPFLRFQKLWHASCVVLFPIAPHRIFVIRVIAKTPNWVQSHLTIPTQNITKRVGKNVTNTLIKSRLRQQLHKPSFNRMRRKNTNHLLVTTALHRDKG